MKKAFFISAVAILFSLAAFASPDNRYCDLVVYRPGFKNYLAEMHVDSNTHGRQALLRDTNGTKIKFASPADALNYVARQGWELVSCYSEHGGAVHFILRR